MGRNEWYKEQYDLEWAHRAHLFDQTRFCMVAATVIGTAIAAAAHGFDYGVHFWLSCPFVVLLAASALLLLVGLLYVCRSLVGQDYSYPPKPGQLERHFSRVTRWAEARGRGENPDELFDADLSAIIVGIADANFEFNRAKGSLVQRALWCLAWSLLPLFGAGLLYLASMFSLP